MTTLHGNLRILKVSYETVRKVAVGLDRRELERRRHGQVVSEKTRAPRAAGVQTIRPLERVEIDNFLIDVHLVCEQTGALLGRPWLTLAIDHYSGMVLGYFLSFATPSAASVLAALRHAILPKEEPHEQPASTPVPSKRKTMSKEARGSSVGSALQDMASAMAVNPAMGIPDVVVVDNGLDLLAHAVVAALDSLVIEAIYTPPRTPWYKGVIERFGRTLNMRFIHWLPGTTLGKQMREFEYNPRAHACISYADFRTMLDFYVANIHNVAPRRGKFGTPLRRWSHGVSQWPVRLPESEANFDAIFALTFTRTLRQTGISFADLFFNSDQLGMLWNRLEPGTTVRIKVDPTDIRAIHVIDPRDDSAIKVPCLTHFDYPRPYAYHIQVQAWRRKEGHDASDMASLARDEAMFRRAIEEAAANGKKALRRMQANLLTMSSSVAEPSHEDTQPLQALASSLTKPEGLLDSLFEQTELRNEAR